MHRTSLSRRFRAVAATAALVVAAAVGVSAPAGAVPVDGYPLADVPTTGSVMTSIPVQVTCPFVDGQPWTIASWITSEGSGMGKTAHGTFADAQMIYSGSVWFGAPAPTGYVEVKCGYEDGDGRETWVSSDRFPIAVSAPAVATTTTLAVAPTLTLPGTLPVVATVATTGGAVTTGSVQFALDGVDVGAPVAVDVHGEARGDVGTPAPGHRSVTARYLGAPGFTASPSAPSSVVVLAASAVMLELPATATDTEDVRLRAVVTGDPLLPAPGGTVTFTWADGPLGSAPVVGGAAVLDVPLPAGEYTDVRATYSGDEVYGESTTGPQTLVVSEHVAPRPVVTVDVPATAAAGPVQATVTVAGPHSGDVTPEGDVQLIVLDADEHYLLHVNATLVDGTVTVTTPALAAGTYTVLAHYSGSSTQGVYAQADSTDHALTVTAPVVTPTPDPTPTPTPVVPTPAPVPALTGSTSSTTPGGSVTLVARGFLPGETVQFHLHSDPVLLGTAVADAAGVATLVTTVPAGTAAGLHHVVATGTTSQRTAQIELTVAAAATSSGARLASTGADPAGLLGLVAALLVAGAAMVAAPRVRARR